MIIYKYKLGTVVHQVIELPEKFKPLRVEFQGEQLCLWAIVNPLVRKNNYDFYIVGTGWEQNDLDGLDYISTVFENGLVWHIFYRK